MREARLQSKNLLFWNYGCEASQESSGDCYPTFRCGETGVSAPSLMIVVEVRVTLCVIRQSATPQISYSRLVLNLRLALEWPISYKLELGFATGAKPYIVTPPLELSAEAPFYWRKILRVLFVYHLHHEWPHWQAAGVLYCLEVYVASNTGLPPAPGFHVSLFQVLYPSSRIE